KQLALKSESHKERPTRRQGRAERRSYSSDGWDQGRTMDTIISPASVFNSTISSTGTDPAGWRRWWREQAQIDGTDWSSLHRQLVGAWRALRALAEVSS